MSKNIVVLSDGTGQEGGKGHDSNIYKLFRMLEDRTDRQIVFYDEGLGTDWHKITGNAFGAGFSNNLLQGYQFIYDNYNAGDRIYLFGFSRGAATVRSLSSFIHYFGILPKSRPELIKKAYKLYKNGQDKVGSKLYNMFGSNQSEELEDVLNKKALDFVHEHPNQWVKIEFLGVWDTVPALGLVALAGFNTFLGRILRYNYHNYKLHPSVKNACHALSIDDDRLWFHPSLWKEKTREEQLVDQVWFSGAHTDIGGGFHESGLSDITLEWMLEKAVSYGLRIHFGSRKNWNFVVSPDPTDLYHPPRKGFGKIFKYGSRKDVWNRAEAEFGAPIIHRSVLERHKRSKAVNGSEDDRNPWILEKTTETSLNENSNNSQNVNFKEFLRRKFYETVKFEWKRYDWKRDQQQTKKFDEWIGRSEFKEFYNSPEWVFQKVYMEDGYKEYCKAFWKDPEKDSKQLKTRNEWRREYSEEDWLKGYQPYQNWLKDLQDLDKEYKERLDPDWLEGYRPYQEWYEEHTEKYNDEVYYFEPFKRLAFEKVKGFKCYSVYHDSDKENMGELIKEVLSLRDYEQGKHRDIYQPYKVWGSYWLKEQIEEHDKHVFYVELFKKLKDPESSDQEITVEDDPSFDNMFQRGYNEKKRLFRIERFDRVAYDLSRWMGNNDAYNTLFSIKNGESKKEI